MVKFEDGWPWPIFRGHGGWFQHETLNFLHVNIITPQILVILGTNLYHRCISRVSWLSSKMGDLDLIFEVMEVDSTWNFEIFACKHDNSTNISHIGAKLIPWMYRRSVLVNSKLDDRDLFFEVIGVDFNMEICNFCWAFLDFIKYF